MGDYLGLFGVKVATIVTAAIAAVITVAFEIRNHSLLTAIGSIAAGVFVAVIFTDPTVEFLGAPESWGQAIAAGYGITGRNLIIWLRRVSNDPAAFLRDFWKGPGDRGSGDKGSGG